ncbi:MAG: hypothetical protein HYV67_03180 [Candidatus Taylorbacteria bacterium]|nr:hypothetical protein [Candidatus Taylorbacteria bacterium]
MTADDNPLDDCAWILFFDSSSLGLDQPAYGIKEFFKKILGIKDRRGWPVRPLYEEALQKNMGDKMALILWEGKVNNPLNYSPRVWDKFKTIFTWDDDLVDDKKFFKFFLPTPTRPPRKNPLPFEEKKLLVNMSANRYYPRPRELYSARAKTSAYFDSHYPDDFDLFGARWHTPTSRWQKYFPALIPKFACWRGVSQDKMETLSRYKFALCYENLSGTKGYITEKIFDTIQAGTVPIYWGASNIETYVDREAFVDRRRFKSDAALAKYLKSVTEEEYRKMISAGQTYLETGRFGQFSPAYFCDRIMAVLNIPKAASETSLQV